MKIRGAMTAAGMCLLASMPMLAQYSTFGSLGMGVMQRQMEPQRLELRPWVMANAMYWHNLSEVDETQSNLQTGDLYGGMLGWGVSGGKAMERSSIALSYTGAGRYVSNRSGLLALSNVGTVAHFKQLNKEWSLSNSIMGGTSAGSYGLAGAFGGLGAMGFGGGGLNANFSPGGIGGFEDPYANGIVEDEVFDNRIYFGGMRSTLMYSPNYRWQIGGGGVGVTAHRTAAGLFDVNSVGAFGQASYLIDRTTNVTGGYSYTRLWYPGVLRDTGFHSVSGGMNRALGRRTMVSGMVSWSRFSSTAAAVIPLDPLLAELLGTGTSIEIRTLDRNVIGGGARIHHVITDKLTLSGRFSRGINPGNGVLLTAERNVGAMSLGYQPGDRWAFQIGVIGTQSTSLLQEGTVYRNLQGATHVSVQIAGDFRANFGGGYRWLRLPNLSIQRQAFATVGVMWSPGGGPMRWF